MLIEQAADDFLLYLQVERNYSVTTLVSYEYDLKTLQDFLVNHKRSLEIEQLTSSTIRRYIQDQVLHHQAKPRTMARKISCFRSFSKFALKEKWITIDFMAGIETPKLDNRLANYMSMKDLKKLLSYLEKSESRFALRNHLLFRLLATSGMRRQEVIDLTWQQIDLDNQTVKVFGKGKKERLLPLHPSVIELFHDYQEGLLEYQLHPKEPVFLNKYGKKFNPRGLHIIFKECLEKSGLPPTRFSLHHLRHTFATLMLQENKENIDLRTLQDLLGHENLSTTSVYTHVDFAQKKKAVDTFLTGDEPSS
jgi:integrase/recombinase XerD